MCDGIDNNCNGATDENCISCPYPHESCGPGSNWNDTVCCCISTGTGNCLEPTPTPTPTPTPNPSPTPSCGELGAACSESYSCCPWRTCGDITDSCIPCIYDPAGKGGCASEYCYWCYLNGGTYCDDEEFNCWTPLLIDISGNGFNLTDAVHGVNFDAFGKSEVIRTAWTSLGSDDAWLVLDRNCNGTIDNGMELFSSAAAQPTPPVGEIKHGFRALAEYDKPANGGNGDGVIDNRDEIFSSLQLWQDFNHNGISEIAELHTLPEFGLISISLDYKESRRTDRFGNNFHYRAKVDDLKHSHIGRWAWDVFPVVTR